MKERLVTCNEEDTDGRARVTRDEERVLPTPNDCSKFHQIRFKKCDHRSDDIQTDRQTPAIS